VNPVAVATDPLVRFHSFTQPPRLDDMATREPFTETAVAVLDPMDIDGTVNDVRFPELPTANLATDVPVTMISLVAVSITAACMAKPGLATTVAVMDEPEMPSS
jgi:hypothetical protein